MIKEKKLSQITKHQLYRIAHPDHPSGCGLLKENAYNKNIIPCFATFSEVISIKLVFQRTRIYAQKNDKSFAFSYNVYKA